MADTGNQFGDAQTRQAIMDTNLADKEYYFASPDSTDDNVFNLATAGTAIAYPILEGKDGSTTAKAGAIVYGGRAKVIIAATIGAGVPIMPDGNGKGVAATDGKYFSAITVKGGVSGDIVECIVTQGVWKTVS